MSAVASDLALFWAAAIAIAILIYVVLDGFDLGVGILFGLTRDEGLRRDMVQSIDPFWDGNETWLVVIGASLFAAFPAVYAVFTAAFYIPVLLLLFGLIFRGIAFEFRGHGRNGRRGWDIGFWLGSAVVAFVQGAAVGALIRGLPVRDGQFDGGPFVWLAPLPVLCGLGLVAGYALLGTAWLVLKTEGALQAWARRRLPVAIGAVVVVLTLAFAATLFDNHRIQSHLAGRRWIGVLSAFGVFALVGAWIANRRRRELAPFVWVVVFFLSAFLTLAGLFWPFMVPYALTIADAAAPDASLSFFFWGAGVFALPVVLLYTAGVYWVFRGKARSGPDRY